PGRLRRDDVGSGLRALLGLLDGLAAAQTGMEEEGREDDDHEPGSEGNHGIGGFPAAAGTSGGPLRSRVAGLGEMYGLVGRAQLISLGARASIVLSNCGSW